jgi:ubiquinone/menaquinone biosynthesis C-methylase UbiE
MSSRSGRNQIEQWILTELAPSRSTTAELAYERMESQSARCLPVLYLPLDYRNRGHWLDTAICCAFAHALRGADTVLDIGPGDGWPCLRIADRFQKIVGIDPSPRRVRVQKENAERLGIANVEFLLMDAMAMPFADESFGGVTAASSIEQTDDPARALSEVFRVLRPGGALAMVFDDYETYFPDGSGDEELWSEMSDDEIVLFYQVRTKSPARESRYALFLSAEELGRNEELASVLRGLSEASEKLENLDHGEPAPTRPQWFGLDLFTRLRTFTRETKYFDLGHLTSSSLDGILGDIGFADVRHTSYRFPDLRAFFDAARETGKLDGFADSFVAVCDDFGIAAIRAAGRGPGEFAIARTPGPKSDRQTIRGEELP